MEMVEDDTKECTQCGKGGMLSYARFCGYCGAGFARPKALMSQLPTQEEPLAVCTPPAQSSSLSPKEQGESPNKTRPDFLMDDDDPLFDEAMLRLLETTEANAAAKAPVANEAAAAPPADNSGDKPRVLPAWMSSPTSRREHALELREEKERMRADDNLPNPAPPVVYTVIDSLASGWWKGRIIVLDVETTGFSRSDSLIEIGAVELVNGRRTGCLFQSHMRPHSSSTIHPLARQVHNVSDAFLADQPSANWVLSKFLAFVGDSPLVAHNADFDMRMLCQDLDRYQLPLPGNSVFCTMRYEKRRGARSTYTLSACANARKIPLPERLHGALVDAELCACLFMAIVDSLSASVQQDKENAL